MIVWVEDIEVAVEGAAKHMKGGFCASTDTKPTGDETLCDNSALLELDTGDVYSLQGGAWVKKGGN